jgi:hypothetical protein
MSTLFFHALRHTRERVVRWFDNITNWARQGAKIAAFAALANAAILALLTQTATAGVWVFGDSNVDTGWYKTSPFSGAQIFDIYLADASLGVGKQTNNPGPMSVEVLAALLHMTANPANQGGTNYATSGAKNALAYTTLDGDFSNAVPTARQILNYLRQHTPTSNDLFVVDSGANDVSFALNHLTEFSNPTRTGYIADQALNLASAIKFLQLMGATHIIVTNQPENFGNADAMAYRHIYNTTLKSALDLEHVPYAWGDANGVRNDIVANAANPANPARFNIQYTDTHTNHLACRLKDPPPDSSITRPWAILCSSNSPVVNPVTELAEQSLFADDVGHWASGAQRVLGSYYYCLVRANWPQLTPPTFPPQPLRLPISCLAFSEFRSVAFPVH